MRCYQRLTEAQTAVSGRHLAVGKHLETFSA
jgi:hypothetical protein